MNQFLTTDRTDGPGAAANDNGRAGCVARDGSLVVAGSSAGGTWPLRNAFQDTCHGPGDAIVARLAFVSTGARFQKYGE